MMVKSTAVSDAGLSKQTIYEAGRETMHRQTYDRAVEAMDDVNWEIERLVRGAGGGRHMKGRDALREMLNNKTGDVAAVPPKRTSGAVRAMSVELQHLSEEASTARALRQTLAASEPTVELARSDIDPSPVADRIPTDQTLRLKY